MLHHVMHSNKLSFSVVLFGFGGARHEQVRASSWWIYFSPPRRASSSHHSRLLPGPLFPLLFLPQKRHIQTLSSAFHDPGLFVVENIHNRLAKSCIHILREICLKCSLEILSSEVHAFHIRNIWSIPIHKYV